MPVALILAFAASLGLHLAALFGPEIELEVVPDASLIVAELKPLPTLPAQPEFVPPASVEHERQPERITPVKRRGPREKKAIPREATTRTTPAMINPQADYGYAQETVAAPSVSTDVAEITPQAPGSPEAVLVSPRLPPRGSIRFSVDRGDSNFEVGVARHDWELKDGHYRLSSVIETTGLVWLFRSVSIEMESVGRISDRGFQPEAFGAMREGRRARERALFDWETMIIRVGERRDLALDPGAQDFLSFIYQLGFMEMSVGETKTMFIATGKKYAAYHLESLGDEAIEIPLGALRTRHIRSPGESTIDLWLAYDYRLLPVKIRHVDKKGGVTVLMATHIQLGQ